jgi:uncharacterized Zn finger protein
MMRGVPVFTPASAELDAKAHRLLRNELVESARMLGRRAIYRVWGDAKLTYTVVLWWRDATLYGTCSCPNHGRCSHILAAGIHSHDHNQPFWEGTK